MKTGNNHLLIRIILILILLVTLSVILLDGVLAKYIRGDRSQDSARVAVFRVTDSGELLETQYALSLDPISETTVNNAVEFVNDSEVSVRCILTMNSSANLPLIFEWDDGTTQKQGKSGDEVSFDYNVNHDSPVSYDLTVRWDDTDEQNKSFMYNKQVDKITLTMRCEQID